MNWTGLKRWVSYLEFLLGFKENQQEHHFRGSPKNDTPKCVASFLSRHISGAHPEGSLLGELLWVCELEHLPRKQRTLLGLEQAVMLRKKHLAGAHGGLQEGILLKKNTSVSGELEGHFGST